VEHVFSCEIEPYKQAYIERNFAPPILFRDVRELGGAKATTAYGAQVSTTVTQVSHYSHTSVTTAVTQVSRHPLPGRPRAGGGQSHHRLRRVSTTVKQVSQLQSHKCHTILFRDVRELGGGKATTAYGGSALQSHKCHNYSHTSVTTTVTQVSRHPLPGRPRAGGGQGHHRLRRTGQHYSHTSVSTTVTQVSALQSHKCHTITSVGLPGQRGLRCGRCGMGFLS
jgi:hypothetical protein